MTRATTHTMTTVRLLLAMTATLALALGLAFASPAAAQFVDEGDQQQAEEPDASARQAPESNGNGFVGDDDHEAAPVGGVDTGFGGGTEQGGLGAPHAAAGALLALALAGHAANARRSASVRA